MSACVKHNHPLDYMIPARHVSSRNAVSKPVRGTNFRGPGSLYYWSRVLAQPPASYLSTLLRCSMRLPRIVFLALITTSVATLAKAQQQDWMPQGIESLGQNASSRTEF